MRIFQNSCQVVQKLLGIIKHWEKNLSVFRGHITKSTRCLFQEHLTLKVLPLNPLPNLSLPSPISMKAISIYNFFFKLLKQPTLNVKKRSIHLW